MTMALPTPSEASDVSEILEAMSTVLAAMAQETTDIQSHVAPMIEAAETVDCAAVGDLQRLDRHAQYLVELARLATGLSETVERGAISAPDLCRLVQLPSLRNRFLGDGPDLPEDEPGSVSMF